LFHAIKVVKISEILSDFRGRAFFLALLLTNSNSRRASPCASACALGKKGWHGRSVAC